MRLCCFDAVPMLNVCREKTFLPWLPMDMWILKRPCLTIRCRCWLTCVPVGGRCQLQNLGTAKLFFKKKNGRGERIRTSDFLLPKQARYRAAPRPATIHTITQRAETLCWLIGDAQTDVRPRLLSFRLVWLHFRPSNAHLVRRTWILSLAVVEGTEIEQALVHFRLAS